MFIWFTYIKLLFFYSLFLLSYFRPSFCIYPFLLKVYCLEFCLYIVNSIWEKKMNIYLLYTCSWNTIFLLYCSSLRVGFLFCFVFSCLTLLLHCLVMPIMAVEKRAVSKTFVPFWDDLSLLFIYLKIISALDVLHFPLLCQGTYGCISNSSWFLCPRTSVSIGFCLSPTCRRRKLTFINASLSCFIHYLFK